MEKKKNIIIGLLLALLSIFFLTIYVWILPVYNNYKYYKSEKFSATSWRIQNQFFGTFIDRKYRNPVNGNEFLDFCNKELNDNFGREINANLLNDGLEIIENQADSTILILSLGQNRKRNKNKLSLFPEEMNFLTYLIKRNDVIICKFDKYTICDIWPKKTRIYKDSILLAISSEQNFYKLLKEKVYSFSNDYFGKKIFAPRSIDTTSLLLKAIIRDDLVEISIICDPYRKNQYDYSGIINSLSDYLSKEELIKEKADYFYFLLSIDISSIERE